VFNDLLLSCYGDAESLQQEALANPGIAIGSTSRHLTFASIARVLLFAGVLTLLLHMRIADTPVLEIQYDPPHTITVSFTHSASQGISCLTIVVEANGGIQAQMHAAPQEVPISTNSLVTKLLNATHNIPLTISNLLQRFALGR
jgi:hypothetical protein